MYPKQEFVREENAVLGAGAYAPRRHARVIPVSIVLLLNIMHYVPHISNAAAASISFSQILT